MASDVHTIRRFSATERWVHWIHAAAFFVLLGSGLVLYLPSLASAVGRRPFVKDVHVDTVTDASLAAALTSSGSGSGPWVLTHSLRGVPSSSSVT